MQDWFKKQKSLDITADDVDPSAGRGLWKSCKGCEESFKTTEWEQDLYVCRNCGFHQVITPELRIAYTLDENSFEECNGGLGSTDIISFTDSLSYGERIEKAVKSTGMRSAIATGVGSIDGRPVAVGVMNFRFMGGSMGSVVGEKVARLAETAAADGLTLVVFSSSGGARMQEGLFSLMQMAKTSAALGRLRQAGLPFISVLTHPTTGGTAASFAFLGDVIIAEPGALIGFAGPRVIEQTIRQALPEGFQRSEFLLEKGFVDIVCPRGEMRTVLSKIITHLSSARG